MEVFYHPEAPYTDPVQSLKSMASKQVALSLWHHENASYLSDIIWSSEEDHDRIVERLKVPPNIADVIKNALRHISNQIGTWLEPFRRGSILPNILDVIDLNVIVWRSNGYIDEENTARKLLSTKKLKPSEKFYLMFEFCLEDEIVNCNVRSLMFEFCLEDEIVNCNVRSFPKLLMGELTYSDLLKYWVKYLKKELHTLQLSRYRVFNRDRVEDQLSYSVEVNIALNSYGENWPAFKFFWHHRLNSNDRELVVKKLFQIQPYCRNRDSVYWKFYSKKQLFFSLSNDQQRNLLSQISDRIILDFYVNDVKASLKSAMGIWMISKEFINIEQFSNLTWRLLHGLVHFETDSLFFIRIWKTAPNHLRNFLTDSRIHEKPVISKFLCNEFRGRFYNHSNIPLHLHVAAEFLSLKKECCVDWIIWREAHRFGPYIEDFDVLNEFLDLYLVDDYTKNDFKSRVADSENFEDACWSCLKSANFKALNKKLQFYLPNRSAVQEFIMRLILRATRINATYFIHKFEDWKNFSYFIDFTFSDDAYSPLEIKKRFLSSVVSNNHHLDGFDNNEFTEVMKVVETIFVDEELDDIKCTMLVSMRNMYVDRNFWDEPKRCLFDVDYMIETASWCLRDDLEEDIEKFKTVFLPVDVFFDGIFRQLMKVCEYQRWRRIEELTHLLSKLEKCLRWYISCKEERKKYKLTRINLFENFRIFHIMICNHVPASETILGWLFDGNEAAMKEFESSRFGYKRS